MVVSLGLIRKTGGHPAAIIILKLIFADFILNDFIYCCQKRAVLRSLEAERGQAAAAQIQGQIFLPQPFKIITHLTSHFGEGHLTKTVFSDPPSFPAAFHLVFCSSRVASDDL